MGYHLRRCTQRTHMCVGKRKEGTASATLQITFMYLSTLQKDAITPFYKINLTLTFLHFRLHFYVMK